MATADTAIDFGLLAGALTTPAMLSSNGATRPRSCSSSKAESSKSIGNRVLDTLPERSIFGEMALIDGAPRSATAATGVKLVPVGEKQFLFLVSWTPHFALNVMRALARRLRATNNAL